MNQNQFQPVPKKKKAKKPKNTLQGFLLTFGIAFLVFAFCSTAVLFALDSVANKQVFGKTDSKIAKEVELPPPIVDENSPFFEAFRDSKRVNVLVLGVNSGMTDTIMLASFDRATNRLDVISVPRDTYYPRPGHDLAAEKKINAAYRGNPLNTAYAVSDVLNGMPINYYAVVKYDGVKAIVNSMGGVPMDIPSGGMYYKDPYDKPPLVISIPEGYQVLDGDHAVQFLRYRHGYTEGDIGRVKAQQEFVKSAVKQCLSFNLPKIANTVFDNVESNITIGAALSIATKAVGMKAEDMHTFLMPHTLQGEAPWYVYPDEDLIDDMLYDIYSLAPPTTSEGAVSDSAVTEY